MDIWCPRCNEPWDNDELHIAAEEQDGSYSEVAAQFRSEGCSALTGTPCEPDIATDDDEREERLGLIAGVYAIVGDDMDAASALIEDLGGYGF